MSAFREMKWPILLQTWLLILPDYDTVLLKLINKIGLRIGVLNTRSISVELRVDGTKNEKGGMIYERL